jgi:tripartite-type tricarboxylate transporter receptor subunit TctC
MMTARRALALSLFLMLVAAADDGSAQSYPARPVRLIVPYAVGGGADILGRLFAQKLTENLGRTFFVDTRTGAGGNVGAEITVKSPPDGHTIMLTTNSMAAAVTLYPKANFSAVNDLIPITLVGAVPLVLVTHPSVPAKTVKELAALARKRPAGLNFGSSGSGGVPHLSGVWFGDLAQVNLTHVPYKGAGAAMIALLSGEIDMAFVGAIGARPHLQTGKLRALAVSTLKPSNVMPGVPTMDSFYPGFDTNSWYGFFVPVGTPPAIVARLNDEIEKAQRSAEIRAAMARDGAEPVLMGPAEFPPYFRREVEKYAKLVKLSGAKPE